jgi:D-amino-acid oxidase
VLVVGAGVAGLSTAICLAETGLAVTIRTDRDPLATTSAVAGAIWGPHLVEAGERTTRWGRETLAVFRDLAAEPASGVRIASGTEVYRGFPPVSAAPPDSLAELGGCQPCGPDELPPGFSSGWRYAAPLAHMPTYLGYLQARFRQAGGSIEAGTVSSLAGVAAETGAGVVVNCSGVHAHRLAGDLSMTPVRGQTVVTANPGVTEFFIGLGDESNELVYLFPHRDTVILGGTQEAGDWNLDPVPAVADRILRDCVAIEPRLAGVPVLAHRVGLRPVRPSVRLAAEPRTGDGPLIVHNYGHGGGGVTLSWGCAREAAQLATQG